MSLTASQLLKFRLLAEGIQVLPQAKKRLDELRGQRKLTPADYASTTGLILRLEDEVWINAPVADHNRNFVSSPRTSLEAASSGFVVRGDGLEASATVWLPPLYHDTTVSCGRPVGHFTFTHGDRVRLSPIRGCAMRCDFCNIPFEDKYETKPIDAMMEALDLAFCDPLQPARHLMISGGTPAQRDVPFLREVYERVLETFDGPKVDIMMAPVEGLFDLEKLKRQRVNELSINIELFDARFSERLMPQKFRHGAKHYLDFIGRATEVLGRGRVRSMLMVGLEPIEATLAGVQAILDAGGIPVLSPFRPSPVTPLRDIAPLSAEEYERVFLEASEIAARAGSRLGPSCPPCTHNTLTLVPLELEGSPYNHEPPVMV